jgi:hypothetical protein
LNCISLVGAIPIACLLLWSHTLLPMDNGRILDIQHTLAMGSCFVVLKDGYWSEESWSCCLVMDGCVMFSDVVAIV